MIFKMLIQVSLVLGMVITMGDWSLASAQDGSVPTVDTGDTAWILMSSALVLCMMLPGLALFYGGLVRSKNVLGTIMHTAVILCLITLVWVICGYSLAFGPDVGGVIGSLAWMGLQGVGMEPSPNYASTIPHQVFMVFQLMFAAITVALITGAVAERMNFKALLVFSVVWSLCIYSPLAHWVWGGGWLGQMGALDFAGGAVVHISSGFGALVCAMMLGPRKGFGKEPMPPHNLPMTVLGTGLLWFGWFGFNGGSVLSADPALTSLTLVTTCLAAAAGGVSSFILSTILHKNLDLTMYLNGILGGLVGITAGADQMSPEDAILIGSIPGLLIVIGVWAVDKMKLDDPVGAIAVHLIAGIWGTLAVGLFGELASGSQFVSQLIGIASYAAICIPSSFLIFFLLKKTMGLRVSEKEEIEGIDLHEHGMEAYAHSK